VYKRQSQNRFVHFGNTVNDDIIYYVSTTYGVEELVLNRVDLRGQIASVEEVDQLFLDGIIPPNLGVHKLNVFSRNDSVFVLATINNFSSNFLLKVYDIETNELLYEQPINTAASSDGVQSSRASWSMSTDGFTILQSHNNRDFIRQNTYSMLGLPIDSADVLRSTITSGSIGWSNGPSSNGFVFSEADTYYQVRYKDGQFESRPWDLSDLPQLNRLVAGLRGDSVFIAGTQSMLPDTGRINVFASAMLPINTLVNIREPSSGENITLSPNPASQTIRLSKELVFAKASVVRIFATATGQVLQTLTFGAGDSLSQIDVQDLPAGNYVLQIEGQEANVARFIVQH